MDRPRSQPIHLRSGRTLQQPEPTPILRPWYNLTTAENPHPGSEPPQPTPEQIPVSAAAPAATPVPAPFSSNQGLDYAQELTNLREGMQAMHETLNTSRNASQPNSDGAGPSGLNAPPRADAAQVPPVGAFGPATAPTPPPNPPGEPMDVDGEHGEGEGEAADAQAPTRHLPSRRVTLKLFPPKLPRVVNDPDIYVNHIRQLDNFLRHEPPRQNEYAYVLQSTVAENSQILDWVLEYLDSNPEHNAHHCKDLFLKTFAPM